MSDKYNRKPDNYQSKMGYDTLIQNVILKEILDRMSTRRVDIDIELKKKISRMKYSESKSF